MRYPDHADRQFKPRDSRPTIRPGRSEKNRISSLIPVSLPGEDHQADNESVGSTFAAALFVPDALVVITHVETFACPPGGARSCDLHFAAIEAAVRQIDLGPAQHEFYDAVIAMGNVTCNR